MSCLTRSLLNRVPCTPCIPAWSTCSRAKSMPASHFRAIVPINVPKDVPIFQVFSKSIFNIRIFQLGLTFANFQNIWAILENLSRETKNLYFDVCKISLRKNLINLKHLTSFSMEHVGLTKQLFGQCKIELSKFFYGHY